MGSETMNVPCKVGEVLRTRWRAIQTDTGADIKVGKSGEDSTPVFIVGGKEECEKARAKVQRTIDRADDLDTTWDSRYVANVYNVLTLQNCWLQKLQGKINQKCCRFTDDVVAFSFEPQQTETDHDWWGGPGKIKS